MGLAIDPPWITWFLYDTLPLVERVLLGGNETANAQDARLSWLGDA
jgi:hypothetical protein